MNTGLFITLEGPEGAGKTTQTARLAAWLGGLGLTVHTTREPGAGKIGAQIRQVLLNPENVGLNPLTEALLMAADRAQHVADELRPALLQGQVVICDRYIDSHIAYQGYGRGLSVAWLQDLNKTATDGLLPDLTLLLQLPVQVGLARTQKRGEADRMEQEQLAFHQRLHDGYAAIAAAEPLRVRVIDAAADEDTVQEQIRAAVREVLLGKGLVAEDALR